MVVNEEKLSFANGFVRMLRTRRGAAGLKMQKTMLDHSAIAMEQACNTNTIVTWMLTLLAHYSCTLETFGQKEIIKLK